MCSIPSERNGGNNNKYTVEDVALIEHHARKTGHSCGEILLDEWSTSGKIRPTPETLLNLFIQCNMFRAADYVATEILGDEPPTRPQSGPAAKVLHSDLTTGVGGGDSTKIISDGIGDKLQEVLERLNNHDYSQGNLVSFHIAVIKAVTRDFNQEFCIGNGAFGTVYKMDLREYGGPILANKLLNPVSSVVEDQFLTEIRVLSE
jgi:hypothetical protein